LRQGSLETPTGDVDELGHPLYEQHTAYTGWITFGTVRADLSAYISVILNPAYGYGYLNEGSFVNNTTLTDNCGDPFQAAALSINGSIITTSESIDLLVLDWEAFNCSDRDGDIKAAGKQGESLPLPIEWEPGDTDITYDSVRGLITAGTYREQVTYV
jgi:hypothetical protein